MKEAEKRDIEMVLITAYQEFQIEVLNELVKGETPNFNFPTFMEWLKIKNDAKISD